ncbi:hypothetical protein ABBQ32_010685 [Trebouxia sp. C0010 RCD-2024]
MMSGDMTLQGPYVGCSVVQCLTRAPWPMVLYLTVENSPQLGLPSLSDLCNSVPHLIDINFADCFLDATLLSNFGTRWPQLYGLRPSNNQVDPNAIAALAQACPHVSTCLWNSTCWMQQACSVWCLAHMHGLHSKCLTLRLACINGPDLHCLAQGHWPGVLVLDLSGNNIDTKCLVSCFVRCPWPLLQARILSVQDRNEEACSLLG